MAQVYYYLIKSQCMVDGSAYTSIVASPRIDWGEDGRFDGLRFQSPKVVAKMNQYGMKSFRHMVISVSPVKELAEEQLSKILTPDILAHPLCLNINPADTAQKISAAMTDKPKTPEHREAIAVAMHENTNALGHVKSDESKEAIAEAHSKLKWIHNVDTNEELQIEKDELDMLLDLSSPFYGFKLGRLPKKKKK